jgi:hypothetical protein
VKLPLRVVVAEPGDPIECSTVPELKRQTRKVALVDIDDLEIAYCSTGHNLHRPTTAYPEEIERAKRLAQAINCHEELVAAAKTACKALSQIADITTENRAGWALKALWEAIEKAEGSP